MIFRKDEELVTTAFDWIGQIPSHWRVEKLHWLLSRKTVRNHPQEELLSVYREYGVIPTSSRDDNYNKPSEDLANYQLVEPGDLVLNKMKTWQGSLGISSHKGIASPAYIVCSISGAVDRSFLHYALRSQIYIHQYIKLSYGVRPNQWDMHFEDFRELPLIYPPLDEQRAIAAFLDRETAKIDALITKKERLIALLEEKRQAVISHAVTKGLHPDIAMMDSGNKWLGGVPAHWGIKRVKHLCSHVVDCLHTTPTYDGELEFPAIRTADVERGRLLLNQARLVSREVYEERIQRLRPKAGDVLYSREGERFGIAALVPDSVDLCLGQRMMMFRIKPTSNPTYVMFVLNSETVYQQVLEGIAGATSPHVNISDVINFAVPFPPLEEQQEIAEYISHQINCLDALKSKALAVSDRLKEHRAALIAAAVTGKIDVREAPAENVIPFTMRQRRNILAGEVIRQFHNDNTFGRTKAQKVFYLLNAHLGVTEFEGRYERWIAGPYDAGMMKSVATELESAGWFREVEDGSRYHYRQLTKAGEVRPAFVEVWGDQKDEIQRFIDLLRPLDTQASEVVATLYAAWNDFLLRNEAVDDAKLLTEVKTNWHEAKKAIPERAWNEGLRWMRQHNVVPNGTGSQTIQQMSLGL